MGKSVLWTREAVRRAAGWKPEEMVSEEDRSAQARALAILAAPDGKVYDQDGQLTDYVMDEGSEPVSGGGKRKSKDKKFNRKNR